MSEKCGAIGALTVGGRVVGQLRCELDAGHDEPRYAARQPLGAGLTCPYEVDEPEPHAVTLTWTPEAAPDLDLFDPAEHFDVDVPIVEPIPYAGPGIRYAVDTDKLEGLDVGPTCVTCGGALVDVGMPRAPYFVHRDSTPATRSHSARVG